MRAHIHRVLAPHHAPRTPHDRGPQAVEAEASTLKAAQLEHAAELAQKEVRLKAHRDELLAQLKRALESKAQAVFDASGREAALNAEIDLVRWC